MTKILKIIIILNFLYGTAFSCTCRFEGYNFEFFKTIKYSFVGTVAKIDQERFQNTFTFKVNYIYKGKIDSLVKVISSTSACGTNFDLNKTYLIELEWKNNQYETSRCLFNAQKGTQMFSEDTMLLNLFAKKNVYVNLSYTHGQIKNGKQNGYWRENGTSGMYVNGKRNGIWKGSGNYESYYKNGKFIKSVYYILNEQKTDSAKVEYRYKKSILYYSSGRTHKIMTTKKFIVYYLNGKIKEKVKLNHHHFMYGNRYKYDETGKVAEKKYIENDNSEDAFWYFDCTDVF